MTKPTCPCKGCSERQAWCHCKCDRYKTWLDEYHSQKERINEQRTKLYPQSTAGERKKRWLSKKRRTI